MKKCKYYINGVEAPGFTEVLNYLESGKNLSPDGLTNILKKHGVVTKRRGAEGNMNTYITMGNDSLTNLKKINTLNRYFPGLLKVTDKGMKYGNEFNNPNGNKLYAVEVNEDILRAIENNTEKYFKPFNDPLIFQSKEKLNEHLESLKKRPEQRGSLTEEDSMEDFNRKVNILSANLNANVVVDPDIEYSRVDGYKGGTPTIRINPNKIFKDTVIHEYGHIYVDLLGGINNLFIVDGIEQLRDTEIWQHVRDLYPHLIEDSEEFQKEVITTAIGIEGSKLFDKTTLGRWISMFYEKLKSILGLPQNVAKVLANEMLTNQLRDISKGELSAYNQEQRTKSKGEEIVKNAINVLKKKIAIYNKNIEDLDLENPVNKAKSEYIEKLKELLDELPKLETKAGLLAFTKDAIHAANILNNRLSEIESGTKPTTLKELQYIKNYMNAYRDVIVDVSTTVRQDKEYEEFFKAENQLHNLYKVQGDIQTINQRYLELSREVLAEQLSSKRGRVQGKYRKQYAEEYRKIHGSKDKEGELNYVNERIADNYSKIKEEEKEYLLRILETAPTDLGIVDLWATSGRSLNDDIIQYAVELLDNADRQTKLSFAEAVKSTQAIFKEFLAEKGTGGIFVTNTEKLYDELIEDEVDENGNKTGNKAPYYVGKHYNGFWDHRKARAKAITNKYPDFWSWSKKKRKGIKEYEDYVAWMKENSNGLGLPNDKWLNPQYEKLKELYKQGSAIAKLYEHLRELNAKRDQSLPGYARLYLRLPGITKKTTERLATEGPIDTAKYLWNDLTKVRPDDPEFGQLQVLANEEGIEKQSVPIFYRAKISNEEQSFDLATMALMDYNMSQNFVNKMAIAPDIDIIKEQIANRRVIKRQGVLKKIDAYLSKKGEDPQDLYTEGSRSNALKAIESIAEQRLYGIQNVGKYHKLANGLTRWNGGVALALNTFAATTNVIQGKLMNLMQKAGSTHYTGADLRAAEKKYTLDLPKNLADWTDRVNHSKTHLLNEFFDMSNNYALAEAFAKNNIIKKKFNTEILSQLQHMGEHYIQNTLMYALLNNIKVMDENGNYLTETGTTKDINQAMSLDEAYSVQDGRLVLDSRVKATNKYGKWDGVSTENDIARLLKKISRDLHGNYDSADKALAQRYAIGKLAFFLRKWMVPGFKKRFRGVGPVFAKQSSKVEEDLKYFSRESFEEEEGIYTTTLRFLGKIISGLKNKKLDIVANWNSMTDQEKANIMKTTREAAMIIGAIIISNIFIEMAEGADDDDKKYYYTVAYFARRTFSELSFYSNWSEAYKIAKSPTAATTLIDDVNELASYALPWNWDEWNERYVKGKRKGKLKIIKELTDVIPAVKQFDRTAKDALEWQLR